MYREGIDLVELAEERGFDSAWTSEHHFAEDGFLPSPATALAAFAARCVGFPRGARRPRCRDASLSGNHRNRTAAVRSGHR